MSYALQLIFLRQLLINIKAFLLFSLITSILIH